MKPTKKFQELNTIFEIVRVKLDLTKADFARQLGKSRMDYHTRIVGGARLPSDVLLRAFELSGWTPEEFGRVLVQCLVEERKRTSRAKKKL